MRKRGPLLAALVLCLCAVCSSPTKRPPPNILFVFADDHAYQAISAYGSKIIQTPNIDRLAREGMRFDRCLVTNLICAPSRAVILSGKYSHLNGVLDNRPAFDGNQVTFPKLLQQVGYQTALIGKWHLKSDPTGFDHWEVLPGQGAYYNPDFQTREGAKTYSGHTTDITTDLALDWLKNSRAPDQPFLLMYQQKAPHRNWMPGLDYLSMFDGETVPEPETLFDDYRNRASPARDQEMEIGRHMFDSYDLKIAPRAPDGLSEQEAAQRERTYGRLTPAQAEAWYAAYEPKNERLRRENLQGADRVRWNYQRYIKDYLRCIAQLDRNLGRLLDYLDESGLAENTVVVYSSDQGFYLGEHGWYDKRWMYEESLRTPLIVRWPGQVAPGGVNRAITSNLDFAPTFLDIAGVRARADMQGASLVPLLRSEPVEAWRESFYYHYYERDVHNVVPHYGVATDRYKLIHYPDTAEWELFDRQSDPRELASRYDDPAYEKIQADLHAELRRLRKELQVVP